MPQGSEPESISHTPISSSSIILPETGHSTQEAIFDFNPDEFLSTLNLALQNFDLQAMPEVPKPISDQAVSDLGILPSINSFQSDLDLNSFSDDLSTFAFLNSDFPNFEDFAVGNDNYGNLNES